MPGPCSVPRLWTNEKKTATHKPDLSQYPNRKSGKTAYDKASSKWSNHLANKSANAEKNRKS